MASLLLRLRAKGQITLPRAIVRAAHLEEGDPVEVEATPDGILLRPKKLIDANQAWFWTTSWQAGERAATEDIRAGRVDTYKTSEDFLAALDD